MKLVSIAIVIKTVGKIIILKLAILINIIERKINEKKKRDFTSFVINLFYKFIINKYI